MKSAESVTPFDVSEKFNTAIAPIVRELVRMCSVYDVPLYLCAAVKNTADSTEYVQDGVSAITCGLKLADDWFPKMINVSLGFDTVMKDDDSYYHSVGEPGKESESDAFLDNVFPQ